ncbi:MAG: DUF3617 family protein [Proteobacteria bacterium]|nr:DUF3617 family protein [Pseudomonadota bacterium]
MSTKRAVIGFAVSAAAAVIASAQAGQPPVNMAVDKGLWQLTTHAQVSGVLPPQLQQQLQSMPPAERAKVQAAMQSAMAAAQREHVFKECMTARRLSRGFGSGYQSAQCKSTLVSNTRTNFEYHKVCTPRNGPGHTETARFHRVDPHHVSGTVDVIQTGGGHAMTVHETVEGKWLGSSCGGVKGTQVVK